MGEAIAWANRAARGWVALPKLAALDLYAPVVGGAHDPFNDDGPGPLFIAMLAFPSRDALAAAVASPELALSLGGRPAGLAWTGSAFERHFYPVGGKTAPLTAPFSYVVRYHKPAEDEAAFIRNYVATHPPTLATLPGIRSVMCYFPLPLAAQGLAGRRLHHRQRGRVRQRRGVQRRDAISGAPGAAPPFPRIPAVLGRSTRISR